MNRIKFFLTITLFLISCAVLFAQPSWTIKVVDTANHPITTLTNSSFAFYKYPYGGGDVISGITTTHTGQGTYIATGFGIYPLQLTKVKINGFWQTWIDEKFTGDPNLLFVHLTGTEAIAGDKTFSGSMFFTGNVYLDAPFRTTPLPSAPEYDASLVWKKWIVDHYTQKDSADNTYIHKNFADWVGTATTWYGVYPRAGQFVGEAFLYMPPGVSDSLSLMPKEYIDKNFFKYTNFNSSQFFRSGTNPGTMTLTRPVTDSMTMEYLTIYKDTIDMFANTYSKSWTIGQPKYTIPDSSILHVHYFHDMLTNTYSRELSLTNNIYVLDDEYITTSLTGTDALLYTVNIPFPGTWLVKVQFDYEFTYESNPSGGGLDSIYVYLLIFPSTKISHAVFKCHYIVT